MGLKFNPLTGNFDLTGSGGGGGSAFFADEVATYADLPLDGTAALNSRWLVRSSSGTWPFPNYRQGGIYIRTSIVGSSRDNDYTLADTRLPDVFADSAFLLYDNGDSTRNLQFDLGSITTGTTRTLTAPNSSGTIGFLQSVTSITVSTSHQLTAARNQRVLVNSTASGSGASVYLPASGNAEGDRLEVACVGLTSGHLSVSTGPYDYTVSVTMGLNTQRTFIFTSGAWTVGTVESHTHSGLGPTFASSEFRVTEPSGLATNRLAFSLANITTGATRTLTVPNASGTISLEGHAHAAADITSGTFDNARINWAAPSAIGSTTSAAGTFTTLTGTTQIVGPQGTNVGSSTANAITLGAANTGFHVSNTQLAAVKQGAGVWYADNSGRFVVSAGMTNGMAIEQTGAPLGFSRNISLFPDANGELHQRSGTQSQSHFFYNTFTSATNHERGFLKWNTNVFQIGTEKGSGGGTARALQVQTDGTTRFTFASGGNLFIGDGSAQANNFFGWSGNGGFRAQQTSTGVITLFNWNEDGFNRLQFGGTTSSFPALKRSSTTLQVRLADDSGFAPLQGQLRTHANAVTETITADKTLTLYDAAGTAYKVPCVAA